MATEHIELNPDDIRLIGSRIRYHAIAWIGLIGVAYYQAAAAILVLGACIYVLRSRLPFVSALAIRSN